jgi:hypothetical protein
MAASLDRIRLKHVMGAAALLALAGCVPQPQIVQSPPGPIAAGQGRIWFYRDYEPSVSRNVANVDLNGARVATIAAVGTPVYRDVPAGHYLIAAESWGTDINQTRNVDLGSGQEVFAKILSDNTWASYGDKTSFQRDTYYIWLIPPDQARAQIAANRT